MTQKYFPKIVKIIDKYSVVINAGSDKDVRVGKNFLIIGLGEDIIDPDTGESLGALEIVRGKGRVTHVQNHISTVESIEYNKPSAKREIQKVSNGGRMAQILGQQETVTEVIQPVEPILKPFVKVQIGDHAIDV